MLPASFRHAAAVELDGDLANAEIERDLLVEAAPCDFAQTSRSRGVNFA